MERSGRDQTITLNGIVLIKVTGRYKWNMNLVDFKGEINFRGGQGS